MASSPVSTDSVQVFDADLQEARARHVDDLVDLGVALSEGGVITPTVIKAVIKGANLEDSVEDGTVELPKGDITVSEFCDWSGALPGAGVSTLLQVKNAFDNADTDGGGNIDEQETHKMLALVGFELSSSESKEIFSKLDDDGSGEITFVEFMTAVSDERLKDKGITMTKMRELAEMSTFNLSAGVEELDADKRIASMPILERKAYGILKHQHLKREERREKKGKGRAQASIIAGQSLRYKKLSDRQQARLSSSSRWCVFRAFMAGILSAGASAVAEMIAIQYYEVTPEMYSEQGSDILKNNTFWNFWLIQGSAILFFTGIEVLYIYWDALNTGCKMAEITELPLYPPDAQRQFIATGIVKMCLELPFSSQEMIGIDPMFGRSTYIKMVTTLAYKAKSGVTTFVVKVLAKRVLARAVAKGAFPFLVIPFIGFWNAMVAFWVTENCKTTVLGPPCASSLWDDLVPVKRLTRDDKEAITRAVAVAARLVGEWHPNMEILAKHIQVRMKSTPDQFPGPVEDTDKMIDAMKKVPPSNGTSMEAPEKNAYAWYTLALAICITKVSTNATGTLLEALHAGGFYPKVDNIYVAREAFMEGHLSRKLIRKVMPEDREDIAELTAWKNFVAWLRWGLQIITI